jgi:hypothetical protein
MKPLPGILYPAAVAVLFGSGVMARADLVHWSYQWDRAPLAVGGGTGGVGLTNEPLTHAIGSSDIIATNLSVFSVADPATPDKLSAAGYSLKMTVTDAASHATGTFAFTGQLNGTFSSGSAAITNSFTSATTLPTQTIGTNSYTVTIGPYSAPGPPSAQNMGAIGAHVDVRAGAQVHAQSTPEPSTLILAALGLALVGFAGRLRFFVG